MKTIYALTFIAISFVINAQIVNIPDANFKSKLLLANTFNNIASSAIPVSSNCCWSVSSYNAVDTNNDGQIQVSEAQAIKYLNLNSSNISDITGIEAFSNLQYLDCGYNLIPNLNVSGLTQLQLLSCPRNLLTNLNVSELTNLKVFYCHINNLTNLDVSGLTEMYEFRCNDNQLTSLNVSGLYNLNDFRCNNNQLPSLNVSGLTALQYFDCSYNQLPSINTSGLTNLQYFYCYNNQLSNLDVSGLTNLQFLKCYFNQLTNLNLSGLTNLLDLYCNENQLSSIDVSELTNLLTFSCYNNQLSSLDVSELSNLKVLGCFSNQLVSLFIKNNNTTWQDLNFSYNPNLHYICADEEDTALVQQKNINYGYTNCNVNSYCSFTPGGIFFTINGNNRLDADNNGCDLNDINYPNLKFNITNGTQSGTIISDFSGNYSIPIQAGTHIITPQLENPNYFNVAPTFVNVDFPTQVSPFVQNFCLSPNGLHSDLEVNIIPLGRARPGFDVSYKIIYKNKGNQIENGVVTLSFNDNVMDFLLASIVPDNSSFGVLSWNIGNVSQFQSRSIIVSFNLNSPTETPALNSGNILSYTGTINSSSTDETPADNIFLLNQTVVNSFDPNYKICLEGNTVDPIRIGKDVHYQIHFENTGTFLAENIVVKDIIDTSKFDISTLQIIGSSHNCYAKISGNKVEFIFENINLPFDDVSNDGYVVFKIKTKSTLVAGNSISNSANIYFDYNFPILTNTATSIFQLLNEDSFEFKDEFAIYPIPAIEVLNIQNKDKTNINSIEIYNVLGQVVISIVNPSLAINISSLKSGTYFMKAKTDKGSCSTKFLKE